MLLNKRNLVSYAEHNDEVEFVLSGITLNEALALADATLVITAGETEIVRFEGYAAASVATDNEYVILRVIRKLDESTADAIHALETNVSTAREQASAATLALNNLNDTTSVVTTAAAELGVMTANTQQATAEIGATVAALTEQITALKEQIAALENTKA